MHWIDEGLRDSEDVPESVKEISEIEEQIESANVRMNIIEILDDCLDETLETVRLIEKKEREFRLEECRNEIAKIENELNKLKIRLKKGNIDELCDKME